MPNRDFMRPARYRGWIGAGIAAIALLIGCQGSQIDGVAWQTYTNSRYGFEFSYPAHWNATPLPENRDGRAFHHPDDSRIEIRGWAGYDLVPRVKVPEPQTDNFTTQQGIEGQLSVSVGDRISTMTLTFARDRVRYCWQGRSPTPQFADYYQLFDASARRYRVPSLAP